jgi:hypothetical protein
MAVMWVVAIIRRTINRIVDRVDHFLGMNINYISIGQACSAAQFQAQSGECEARNPPLGFVVFVQRVSCSSGLLR